MGTSNNNHLLDSRMYEVEYLDNRSEILAVNSFAENFIVQVYGEGHCQLLLDEIIDHKRDASALTAQEAMIETKSGICMKVTTKGWELLVSWMDSTTSSTRLADMKKRFPLKVFEYTKDTR